MKMMGFKESAATLRSIPLKWWVVALPISFLITGTIFALILTYWGYLPEISYLVVRREDVSAISAAQTVATNSFFIALAGGFVLGVCLPLVLRDLRKRRCGAHDDKPVASYEGSAVKR
ncbi:MAG: hypothetical protein WBW41_16165 [Verrucomicrobiia bacterium]